MATAPASQPYSDSSSSAQRDTTHTSYRRPNSGVKLIPPTVSLRNQIRDLCEATAASMDHTTPLSKGQIESGARCVLLEQELPDGYLGWTMVALASAYWRDQVATIPPARRLLLLPHCLRHEEACPAEFTQIGLDCKSCGACSLAGYRETAERLGYHVLIAEGSPVVMELILDGSADAIVGVACLNILEKAFDKVLRAGVPCVAVPLLASNCHNTSADEDWIYDVIRLRREGEVAESRSYLQLMRAAARMFQPDELRRLAPPLRCHPPSGPENDRLEIDRLAKSDPIAATELLAYDFLTKGGKYARPFITLAVHDALTHSADERPSDANGAASFPDHVKRTAMSIETFHKASLLHDDIEDDDDYRYGELTLHRRLGVPTAINVGDYLIGMGYRLVSREAPHIGADAVADIVTCLADAHTRLSEGQGAELLWRESAEKRLQPLDALKIYALKTAPAFEAALFTGVRLARPVGDLAAPIRTFARNVGVAFQILNDLKDLDGDQQNQRSAGGDVLSGRPTLLWALALKSLSPSDQKQLVALAGGPADTAAMRLSRVRALYQRAGVFEHAYQLVDKHQQRAEAAVREVDSSELRRLLYFLIDLILERPEARGDGTATSELPIVPKP